MNSEHCSGESERRGLETNCWVLHEAEPLGNRRKWKKREGSRHFARRISKTRDPSCGSGLHERKITSSNRRTKLATFGILGENVAILRGRTGANGVISDHLDREYSFSHFDSRKERTKQKRKSSLFPSLFFLLRLSFDNGMETGEGREDLFEGSRTRRPHRPSAI